MKIREGFILREVAGVFAAVPVEGESRQFHGMIQLNAAVVGKFREAGILDE